MTLCENEHALLHAGTYHGLDCCSLSCQYERMFGTSRIPGRDSDWLQQSDSVHMAVAYKGSWWRVALLHVDKQPLSMLQIRAQLDYIIGSENPAASKSATAIGDAGGLTADVAALTALGRTRWAEIREDFFSQGINKISLNEIESAVFVLHLDDRSPQTLGETAQLGLHGGGHSWWCDKSFNVVVFQNGKAAMHIEHSWADAPVMAHAWEWVFAQENLADCYDSLGELKELVQPVCAPESPNLSSRATSVASAACSADSLYPVELQGAMAQPIRLEWELTGKLGQAVFEAAQAAQALCKDVDLVVEEVGCDTLIPVGNAQFLGYGKGFVKRQGCGPDAWIQMALQLAYFRDQGRLDLTYESAAVRLFNEGRTETIRSASMRSKELVRLMEDTTATSAQKAEAIRTACFQHQKTARDASSGHGVDRHLFALYVAHAWAGEPPKFLKDALSMPFKLSTSQIPQRQTEFTIKPFGKSPMLSPSGGFGPVSDEGYGVSYMMADDERTFFHVSSKHSCATTDSSRFLSHIKVALHDLRAAFLKS